MVADRLDVNTDPDRFFQPLGQEVDRLFGSAADWVGDGKSLSDRLWLAGKLDRQAIDTILRQGIATGKDPLKVARDLEDYLLPAGRPVRDPKTGRIVKWKKDETGKLLRDARGRLIPANAKGVLTRTPRSGKGSYAARRLARTEVSRAFNQGVLQAAAVNPFVEGAKWNLSGSHKEEDACNGHATSHSDGMGPGEYRLDEFPQMPAHPACLCFATKVQTDDVDSVVDRLRSDVARDSGPTAAPAARVGLTPASIKNADSARAYFASIGVQVGDVSGSARVFRLVAEAYEKEIEAGAAVPPRLSFLGRGGKTRVAAYERRTDARTGALYDDRINVYPQNRFWKDPEAVGQELAATNYLVSPNTHGLITHEFGHWRHAQEIEKDLYANDWRVKKTGKHFSSFWTRDAPEMAVARRVSRYAATKPEEFVAEVYSGLRTGVTFDDEVMALYRDLGGPAA